MKRGLAIVAAEVPGAAEARALALALAVAVALAVALAVAVGTPAAEAAPTAVRAAPGAGRLAWKPSQRPAVAVRGAPGSLIARAGNIVVIEGITRIAGKRRHGFAAIDLRTGRPTAFDPPVPSGQRMTAMTVSPTAMYLAYESFDEAPFGPKEIHAYDLRTGALLPAFDPPDFRVGRLGGMVYANGRVVMGGAPPVGAGITLGAYDPTTGAPVWRAPIGWPVRSLATDGSRVFAEVPVEEGPPHLVTAFSASDGSPIGGWGSTLTGRGYRAPIGGADADRVYSLSGRRVSDLHPFVLSTRDGRRVSFPRLPANASSLRPGAGSTLLGTLRVKAPGGPPLHIDAVFERSGRLIGTVPSGYRVLAQRDARRLLVSTRANRTRILELVRPRRR